MRVFADRWLLREFPCHKSTTHLQTSLPSPGFKSRPYGSAVSVTNCYTEWVAIRYMWNGRCEKQGKI
ncbi:hypothetical protein TNCV_2044891 [Trichonephila clavipes]|nr:hypothetical protein TNCV_2044891 [Trichonephila clavipes]